MPLLAPSDGVTIYFHQPLAWLLLPGVASDQRRSAPPHTHTHVITVFVEQVKVKAATTAGTNGEFPTERPNRCSGKAEEGVLVGF